MTHYLLSIDQGTTNSRAIIFDQKLNMVVSHEMPLAQSYPQPGWVEHSPEEMFDKSVECCRQALNKADLQANDIIAIGITNQRETTIIWDKKTGKPIYPAIVWQDRRSKEICQRFNKDNFADSIHHKTGLRLDPYFSASKIIWILENVPGARTRAENGELLFGTVDCYLLWKLTAGRSHKTDISNAARTLLYNIRTLKWDDELLQTFNIPASLLPEVCDNTANFGMTTRELLGAELPICGIAGDQQAAAIGQGCFKTGSSKATFGTGCFALQNTGNQIIESHHHLISTIAYKIDNHFAYALEGSAFSAGVAIKWLRDKLNMISTAAETQTLSEQLESNEGVYLIPAFTGLGAPHWRPDARAAIFGLTRNSDRRHFARAALESVAYQVADLIHAMQKDSDIEFYKLHVDGGMVANEWLLQYMADILQIPVVKPRCIETTALGAAYLAGLQQNLYQSLNEVKELNSIETQCTNTMPRKQAEHFYHQWHQALNKLL